MICTICGTDECIRWCEACGLNYCEYFGGHEDCEPSDAKNPYAKPYDDALAGHLRNGLDRAFGITADAFGIAPRPTDVD